MGTLERLMTKIEVVGDCWDWKACMHHTGYGSVKYRGKNQPAHRVLYLLLVGPVPAGLQLDHLCRRTSCVNPMHMEPVTGRVNTMRGNSFSAVNARKTHCLRGHPFDEANTHVRPSGRRLCRKCDVIRHRQCKERAMTEAK
jgi:hypothetical protein